MTYKFKKGDIIRRINTDSGSFKKGDTATVTKDLSVDDGISYIYFKTSIMGHEISCYVENVELVKPEDLKTPTHIVIWDEPNGDPHKFFISEKKAKEFAKELSKKSEVIEDSIILVEIKTIKKIEIRKSVLFVQHKI